jgi:2-iminobutanoate/2-iminopropanoate deaminase
MAAPARAAETDTAPASYGHRSQAIVAGGFLFTGGQIGVPLERSGPRDQYVAGGSLDEQLQLCLQHMEAITIAVGGDRSQVVEIAAFVAQPDGRPHVDHALMSFLGGAPPLVHYQEVADVALHGLVEMDWVACLDDAMSLSDAALIIKPLGRLDTGSDVVKSGPFLITNAVMGHGEDMTAASEDAFEQVLGRLAPFGAGLDNILKMVVYVDEFDRYPDFNVVTQRLFTNPPLPTRSVIVAPAVTGTAAVRIDLVVEP